MKRILVTGGAGFLGSHLSVRLIASGSDLLCVDNFFTSIEENIKHLLGHLHFKLMREDVTFPLYVEVDEIYNQACPASPLHYELGLAKRVKAKNPPGKHEGDPEVHPQSEAGEQIFRPFHSPDWLVNFLLIY